MISLNPTKEFDYVPEIGLKYHFFLVPNMLLIVDEDATIHRHKKEICRNYSVFHSRLHRQILNCVFVSVIVPENAVVH